MYFQSKIKEKGCHLRLIFSMAGLLLVGTLFLYEFNPVSIAYTNSVLNNFFLATAFAQASGGGDVGGDAGGGGDVGGDAGGGGDVGGDAGDRGFDGSTGGVKGEISGSTSTGTKGDRGQGSDVGGDAGGGGDVGGDSGGGKDVGGDAGGGIDVGGDAGGAADQGGEPDVTPPEPTEEPAPEPQPPAPPVSPEEPDEPTPPPPPPSGGPQPPACILSVNTNSIESGASVELSWTSENANEGSLDQGIGELTPVSGGSVTVTPTSDVVYTATFSGEGGTVTCEASVSVAVTPPPPVNGDGNGGNGGGGGGGNGGGGGGFTPPSIVLTKGSPEAAPLAFVTLSQVPYTGFPAGPAGTTLFWTLLILWSGVVAYFLSARGIGPASLMTRLTGERRVRGDISQARRKEGEMLKQMASEPLHSETLLSEAVGAALMPYNAYAGDEEEAGEMRDNDESYGSESYNGESRVSYESLKDRAVDSGVLLSDGGARYLWGFAREDQHTAFVLLDRAITRGKEMYPRENGWININRERLEALLSSQIVNTKNTAPVNLPTEASLLTQETVLSSAREVGDRMAEFLDCIVNGNTKAVFGLLRMLRRDGKTGTAFLTEVLNELDSAYRHRLEGGGGGNTHVLAQVEHLSDNDIERVIECLLAGVDHNYRAGETGVKIAILKALSSASNIKKRG